MVENNGSFPVSPDELSKLLPAQFSDGRVVAAVYSIPIECAREAVTPLQLYPIALPGQTALAVLCTFEYPQSSIGPYREFAVGIVVRSKPQSGPFSALDLFSTHPDTGAWMLSMPVTSEIARRYGVELFGFPKFVASIDVERLSSVCTTTVADGSSMLLRATVPLGPGVKMPVPWLVTYTQKASQVLRTRIKTKWWVTLSSGGGTRIEIADCDHPMTARLRALKVSKTPIFVLHGTRFRAILEAGERI
jgi:hypothetical protein